MTTLTDQEYIAVAIARYRKDVGHEQAEPVEERSTIATDVPGYDAPGYGPIVILRDGHGKVLDTYFLTEQDDGSYNAVSEDWLLELWDDDRYVDVPEEITASRAATVRRLRELQGEQA